MQQGPFESLQRFYEKFRQVLALGVNLGEQAPHSQQQAERFITELDKNRYFKLQAFCLELHVHERDDAYPPTLEKAYSIARNHKVPANTQKTAYVNATSSNADRKQVITNADKNPFYERPSAPRFTSRCHNCNTKRHKKQDCLKPQTKSPPKESCTGNRRDMSSSEDEI